MLLWGKTVTNGFSLNPKELDICSRLPENILVELAVELDLVVPEHIEVHELLEMTIVRLATLARQEGLPFSEYDRDDLEALSDEHLVAICQLCQCKPSVKALIRAGRRVYRIYRKQRPGSQVPFMVPLLVGSLAQYALETPQLT